MPLSRPPTLLPAIALALLALPAAAKPWHGIIPGSSPAADVVGRFGEPTRTVTADGKSTLVYSGPAAIKGTVQAQFKLDAAKVVQRIDVFPAVPLQQEAIEAAYGPRCTPVDPADPCYVEKVTPAKARYLVYGKLGLAVFFEGEGKVVKNLVFLPPSAPAGR